jgi:hypothetical protein
MTAWPKCSRSSGAGCLGRFHTSSATMMPANEIALVAKTAAGPARATMQPPIAGPTARDALPETLPNVATAGICSRGTTSGWIACQSGPARADAQPMATVNINSVVGVSRPR